jgi:hypothetical protein
MVLDHCVGHVLHRARSNYRTHVFKPIPTLRTTKMKTYHDIDPEEAVTALVSLKNDPNFKAYIKMREAMREEVIRQLQSKIVIDSTNRHFMMTGKLEAIDEELDTFYKL